MYEAEVSRQRPSCFLFLVDQSGSMSESFGGADGRSKSHCVADTLNRFLYNLVIRCTREDGVRDYFDVGILGYGGTQTGSLLTGRLAGRDLVPVSAIADNPARIDRQARPGGGEVMLPVWLDAVAYGQTPMVDALRRAGTMLSSWISAHPQNYPPTVIHITDGESTDGDPVPMAHQVMRLATYDGNVLLFNVHISGKRNQPELFVDNDSRLPDKYAKGLFAMSSVLPYKIAGAAHASGHTVTTASRGFAFNATLDDLIRFIDIGTKLDVTHR